MEKVKLMNIDSLILNSFCKEMRSKLINLKEENFEILDSSGNLTIYKDIPKRIYELVRKADCISEIFNIEIANKTTGEIKICYFSIFMLVTDYQKYDIKFYLIILVDGEYKCCRTKLNLHETVVQIINRITGD